MLKALGYAIGSILSAVHNPGRSKLNEGKQRWQSLGLYADPTMQYGIKNPQVGGHKDHPQVIAAGKLIQEAIDFIDSSASDSADAMSNKAVAYQELGLMYRATNQFHLSETAFSNSLKILEHFGGYSSDNKKILRAYRETCFRIGELNHTLGNSAKAEEFYKNCLRVDGILDHDQPIDERITKDLLEQVQRG